MAEGTRAGVSGTSNRVIERCAFSPPMFIHEVADRATAVLAGRSPPRRTRDLMTIAVSRVTVWRERKRKSIAAVAPPVCKMGLADYISA